MLRYQHKEELFKSNGEGFLDDIILKFTCSFIYSKKVLVDSDRKIQEEIFGSWHHEIHNLEILTDA